MNPIATTRFDAHPAAASTSVGINRHSLRLLRLLAMYRCVAACAVAIGVSGTDFQSSTYAVAFAYAIWALLCYPMFSRYRGATDRLLFVQLFFDIGFLVIVMQEAHSNALGYAIYLLPILAAHGWYLRSKTAFAHAAIATCTVLALAAFLADHGQLQAFFLAGILGISFFLLTSIGLLLGRSVQESEQRAEASNANVRRLAHINQMVISELSDGVLVVGAQGQIVMANPQASRWLAGDEALMQPNSVLHNWSPELYERWLRFFQNPNLIDNTPILITLDARLLLPRMQPIDIDERAGTLIMLEDVAQAEAQAQQIKLAALGRLSASIAHEIRNPLSAIRQASQLIAEEVSNNVQARALTAMVEKNVTRIDRIIRDVSLLGRRDRGTPAPIYIQVFIRELCVDLCGSHQMPPESFSIHAPDSPVTVWADRGHVEEILVNLVTNAWRHASKSEGCLVIDVQTNEQMQRASISIIDDGPGVAPNIADRIFEPFFSGSGSTGLGLYLVRELALANGGDVRLGSSSRGARFVLELPLVNFDPIQTT